LNTSLKAGALAALLVGLSACVDGTSPTGLGASRSLTIAAIPSFAFAPSASVVNALDIARLSLISADSVLVSVESAIDPSQEEWVFELTLDLPADQVLSLRLEIELLDTEPAVDIVEYAGRTDFEVQASFEPQEIREINLGRGPLENLSLTYLRLIDARDRIQEGGSDSLEIVTEGAGPGHILFFESTDPSVATVDSLGNVAALVEGTTLIIARGGRVADTVNLTVGKVDLPTNDALQARLVPHVDYVTNQRFLASFSDAAAALELQESLDILVAEMLAGRGFEAVGKFEEVEDVWWMHWNNPDVRSLDGPQLHVIAIALMHAADALGIVDFL
jgi:hypothetical protein